ncbi:MAG: hypothetical protein ABSG46_08085 [Candidatus Binataceae bacterium]
MFHGFWTRNLVLSETIADLSFNINRLLIWRYIDNPPIPPNDYSII